MNSEQKAFHFQQEIQNQLDFQLNQTETFMEAEVSHKESNTHYLVVRNNFSQKMTILLEKWWTGITMVYPQSKGQMDFNLSLKEPLQPRQDEREGIEAFMEKYHWNREIMADLKCNDAYQLQGWDIVQENVYRGSFDDLQVDIKIIHSKERQCWVFGAEVHFELENIHTMLKLGKRLAVLFNTPESKEPLQADDVPEDWESHLISP